LNILVTFALENEFAAWRAMREFRPARLGRANTFTTQIQDAQISVLLTGVGSRRAELEISKVQWGSADRIEFCVSSGLSGALRPEYPVGRVLTARFVVCESAWNGVDHPLESSPALVSFASDCGATAVGRFLTADRVIARAAEKRELGQRGDAVDMESFAILRAAAQDGVPAVAIRAVSDSVDDDLPLDMESLLTDEGRVSIPRVLGQVALHPGALAGLVKLGKQSKRAAQALAQFLDQYVQIVAGSVNGLESKSRMDASVASI